MKTDRRDALHLAELEDLRRFAHARERMGFVGLVPSEHSSGDSRRNGAITRTTAMPGGCWVMPGGSGDRRVQGRVESLLRADGIAAVGLGQVAEARVGYRLCRFASFATK